MRLFVRILALAVFALGGIARAEDGAMTYYVQLIRGCDEDKPPLTSCQRAGPKLLATFRPVLKCKSFWEICRKEVILSPGGTKRVRLANGREVEIDLSTPNKRRVTSFQNGELVDRTTSPIGDSMTITGGDRDQQSLWFIVVRRDKPQEPGREI